MTTEDQLIMDVSKFWRDPFGFVKYAYPWGEPGELEDVKGPRKWQGDILGIIGEHLNSERCHDPLRIAVASGHGVGKSALIGMLCGWGMSCHPDARINITANTGKQLDTKTWPEMAIWFRRLINSHWFRVKGESICVVDKAHEETWRVDAVPWSENNPAAFAGLHNKRKIVILVMDEASEIPYIVWETSEGALTDEDTILIFLAFGNPTQNSGAFSECFGKNRHRWVLYQIDSRTVEGTNKKVLAEWVRDYGEDSDFVRIRVRGEFPRAGSKQFIAGDVVHDARHRDVGDQSKAYEVMSIDVARFGSNQTVIGSRRGLQAEILAKFRGKDSIFVGNQIIELVVARKPRTCVIDGDGIGGPVADYVRMYLPERWGHGKNTRGEWVLPEWFRLEEFHGGMPAGDGFQYYNLRAEVWGKMRDWLVTGAIPDDPELAADLVGPEYGYSNKNQIQLERKEDMDKRGLASPDSGDCLAMTFGVSPIPKTREEALLEQIQNTADPLERHFMRVRETERRKKSGQPLNYWE